MSYIHQWYENVILKITKDYISGKFGWIKHLSKYNDFALIVIKDQKSLKQKIFEETKNNNILRYYGIGAQILRAVGVKKFDLLTNNPRKVIGLEGFGLEIMSRIQLSSEVRPENKKYIETKKTRMGHKSE